MNISPDKRNKILSRFLFMMIIILLSFLVCFSQDLSYYKNEEKGTSLVLIIAQDSIFHDIEEKVHGTLPNNDVGYFLVKGSDVTGIQIKDSVNVILNKETQIDKTRIYLIVCGDKEFLLNQDQFSNQLFASKVFLQTDTASLGRTSFTVYDYNQSRFKDIINRQKRLRLWQVELDKIKEKTLFDTVPIKPVWDIGMGYAMFYPFGMRTDDEMPDQLSTYGVFFSRVLNDKYKIAGDLTLSPGMLSRKPGGDMVSSDVEEDMPVSSNLMSRSIYVGRYFRIASSGCKPYVGLGLENSRCTIMYSLTNSSSMGMNMERYTYGSVQLSAGVDIDIANCLMLTMRSSYSVSLDCFNTINSFNMFFGLSYKFKRKTIPFYEFLQVRP